MIIWIQGEREDFAGPLRQGLLDALTELGDAGYTARHIVLGPRQLLLHFAALPELSPRARAYFARVAAEYTQLRHVVSHPAHLVASAVAVAPIKYGDTWTVPLEIFAEGEYAQSSKIVCENDTDFEVLMALAEVLAKDQFPGCILSGKSHPGGGAGSAGVVARLLQEPNPIMACLFDSDREIVLGGEGATARGVRAIWRESWRAQIHITTARELENVLPLDAVEMWAKKEEVTLVPGIQSLGNVDVDLSFYSCLKSGEQLCRFHEVPTSHGGYRRTRAALTRTAQINREFSSCGDDCGDCGCRVIPKLGDRFLERFSRWLRQYPRPRINLDSWADELMSAVQLCVTVSLALPRKQ